MLLPSTLKDHLSWMQTETWFYMLLCEYLGEGNGTPLQYSCLENPMDGGAWWATVRGVSKSWTRLSDFTFTFHFHALEKEMATHSSALAWRIPGGLPSMGSHRLGHDWSDLAAAACEYLIHPTQVTHFHLLFSLRHYYLSCLSSHGHQGDSLSVNRILFLR